VIPKSIFFVWLGKNLPFSAALAIWSAKRTHPDFEVILYHDQLDSNLPEIAELIQLGVKLKKLDLSLLLEQEVWPDLPALYQTLESPAARADLIRMMILYKRGGIYLDTDTVTIRDLSDLCEQEGFCGLEHLAVPGRLYKSRNPFNWGLTGIRLFIRRICQDLPSGYRLFQLATPLYISAVNNSVMGSVPVNTFWEEAIEHIGKMPSAQRLRKFRLGHHLMQQLTQNHSSAEMTVYPPSYFFPLGPEISAWWFKEGAQLQKILRPETKVVHWYQSVERNFLRTPLTMPRIKQLRRTPFGALIEMVPGGIKQLATDLPTFAHQR
jgi:hypothetical protein